MRSSPDLRSPAGPGDPERQRGRPRTGPVRINRPTAWAVACAALAFLSVVWLPTPHFDPLAWTIWGREIIHPDVGLSTLDGPSWKPLPVLVTTPLSLLGDAAPAGWLVVARAAGLAAVVLAYRLGTRLGSPFGGGLAALFVLVIPAWAQEVAFGGELGPLVALLLGAVDRHLDERPTQALLLGVGAGLLRTETWPFLAVYGIWAWRRRAVDRRLLAGICVLVPVLWFVPDWVVSGDPFRPGKVARASTEGRTPEFLADPVLEVLRRAYSLLPPPVHVLAVVAVALAVRRRQWAPVLLATGAVAWVALVDAMAVVGGYPGLARFMVPAAAVAGVVGAVGAARLVELVRGRGRAAVAAVAAGLAVALVPFGVGRSEDLRGQYRTVRNWERFTSGLPTAVDQAGGPRRVSCSRPAIRHPGLTPLAWTLGVPIAEVGTQVTADSLVFAPRDPALGGAPPTFVDLPRRVVARTEDWDVYELGTPSGRRRCPRRFR